MAESGITKWHGDKVFKTATKANVVAMTKASLLVEAYVKKHFTLQGTGHTKDGKWVEGLGKRRTRTGKKHYAARAGLPPAIDLGILRASITHKVKVKGGKVIGKVGSDKDYIAAKAEAGTDVEYAYFLEVGTSKMKPRPYLRPALRRNRRKILKIFRDFNE